MICLTFALSPRFLTLLRLRLVIAALPVALILGIVYQYDHIPALVWSVGIFVLFWFLWAVYLPLQAKARKVEGKASALWICKGIIIKKQHILPYSKHIYCKVCTGPLLRLLGLRRVKIRLVGGDLSVDGLNWREAEKLVEFLEGKL